MIETARLLLRPLEPTDFEAFAALSADPECMAFLGGPQVRPIAWRTFMTVAGSWAMQGFGYFSVIERVSGRWIGRVGPWYPDGWPGREVGWGLVREAWGRGYAEEAARAAIDFAFVRLGWSEVIHCIDKENAASVRLAERLGSKLIGPVDMPPPLHRHEVIAYGQTRREPPAGPSATGRRA